MGDIVVPTQRKSFQGVVQPGVMDARGLSAGKVGVRPPEPGETTQTHWQRLEATRQWLVKQGKYGRFAADVLVEQFHRMEAAKAYLRNEMPEGTAKQVLTQILEGKLTVVKM